MKNIGRRNASTFHSTTPDLSEGNIRSFYTTLIYLLICLLITKSVGVTFQNPKSNSKKKSQFICYQHQMAI